MNLAPSRVAAACRALIAAPWFNAASFSVIVINAVVLGLETYDGAVTAAESVFQVIEYTCLACFTLELAIRFGAHLTRPAGFFRDGWNIFDLLIILAPLLPGMRENVTLLRLVRLARIVRAFRLFPSLRVILVGIRRSLPGLGSFLLITVLVLYGYAMLGWMVFGKTYPEEYGTVGQAMLTLFLLLSLDGITDALRAGRAVTEWGILYYLSYMITASYLLTNLLVGVVLNALQEAHNSEKAPAEPAAPSVSSVPSVPVSGPSWPSPGPSSGIGERLARLRTALDDLEQEYARTTAVPAPPQETTEPQLANLGG
jgi:voltage-gated sodium channel